MKRISSLLVVFGLCAALTGCGKQPIELDQNTVYVNKKTPVIVETLVDHVQAGENFTSEELTAYIEEDADYWNETLGEEKVTLGSVVVGEEGDIRIEMNYSDYSGYAYSHNQTFYYATVSQALEEGVFIPPTLVDRNGDEISTTAFTLDGDHYFVIIFSEPIQILTDERIMGSTANVTITGKTTAVAAFGEDEYSIPDPPAYIICKAK